MLNIEITSLDERGAKVGGIGSISFRHVGPISYCVGFVRVGKDMKNPQNWEYHHTNVWADGYEAGGTIPQLEIVEILAFHGGTLSEILQMYCMLISP